MNPNRPHGFLGFLVFPRLSRGAALALGVSAAACLPFGAADARSLTVTSGVQVSAQPETDDSAAVAAPAPTAADAPNEAPAPGAAPAPAADPAPTGEPPPVAADPAQAPPPTAAPTPAEDPASAAEGPAPTEPGAAAGDQPPPGSGLAAEPVGPNPEDGPGSAKEKSLSHVGTGQLGVGAGVGYGLITAGDKFCGEFTSDTSDQDGRKSLCTGRTPVRLDITAGFGAARRVDVVIGLRLNMEKRDFDAGKCRGWDDSTGRGECPGSGLFTSKRGIGVMPGVRLWGMDHDKVFKVGGAVDVYYQFENFDGYRSRTPQDFEGASPEEAAANIDAESKVSDHIFGFRGGPILQVDPHHNIGIYFIPAALPTFRPQQSNATESGWFEISFEATLGIQARFP